MNDKEFEEKVKEDLDTVLGDGQTGLSRLEDNVRQSSRKVKENLTTWAEDGAAKVGQKLEDLKGDALEKVVVAAKTVEQDVSLGLNQYNAKVQELADQVPGGFSKKASRYPWVTISIFLVIGLLLGMLINPTRSLRLV